MNEFDSLRISIELPQSYSSDKGHKPVNLLDMFKKRNKKKLYLINVVISPEDTVVCKFGDDVWDLSVYIRGKGIRPAGSKIDFTWIKNKKLKLETKSIIYGLLYFGGNMSEYRLHKASSIVTIYSSMRANILSFLVANNYDSFSYVSNDDVWQKFLTYIKNKKLSYGTVQGMFVSLSSIVRIKNKLPFEFNLDVTNRKKTLNYLSGAEKGSVNQNLSIPQRLADMIYGKAIDLVAEYWPYRKVLGDIEVDMQVNFEQGKAIADKKIKCGTIKHVFDEDNELNKTKYSKAIMSNLPESYSTIIENKLRDENIALAVPKTTDKFNKLMFDIKKASFICCAAFTGMRVHEIFELTKASYIERTINGTKYSFVKSKTTKLNSSIKEEEWVASPIVKKAIMLVHSITKSQREQLLFSAHEFECKGDYVQSNKYKEDSECLWLNQRFRLNVPVVIDKKDWNPHLKSFVKDVGACFSHADVKEFGMLNPKSVRNRVLIGTVWPISTHQFRRTLATFTVRHHLGGTSALKQQYKHLYKEMTDWYTNGAINAAIHDINLDKDFQNLINEMDLDYMATEYNRFWNTDEYLSGGKGKEIMNVRASSNKPTIYSSWDSIRKAVEKGHLTLNGTLHSYCSAGEKCQMDEVVNPAFCSDCGSSIIDSDKVEKWGSRRSRCIRMLENEFEAGTLTPNIYSHYITQIRASENILKLHGLKFNKYIGGYDGA